MDILTPKNKTRIVLDATLLTAIMNCGRYTNLRFNHNLTPAGGKGNSLEAGSIVHTVFEFYYKSIIQGLNRPLAIGNGLAAGELYIKGCEYCNGFLATEERPKPRCGHTPNQFPGVVNTPAESEGNLVGYNYVLKTCEEYFDYWKNDFWTPLEVEKVKGRVLYEDDNIIILWKAKFDLISDTNNGIFPIDHKTMKMRKDTVSLNNQFIGQCILQETRTMFVNKIGFQSSLPAKDKFLRPSVSYTAERLLEWQNEILPTWAYRYMSYAESDNWEPNFSGNACETKYGKCQFYDVCEANPSMREELLQLNFVKTEVWNPVNEDV